MILQWAARLAHHTLDARQVVVTPDDRGPQINIVAWTCMVVMVLSVATRLAIKYNAFRSFGWDDGLVAAAMILAVCQAVTVSVQVGDGGLGQRISSLTSGEVRSFEKGQYAGDMLYLVALYSSKMSSLAYIIYFTPDARHHRWGKALSVIVSTWIIVALFGVAFECHLPSAWAIVTAQCMNISAFWDFCGIMDIVTDLLLVSLPTYIVWHLHMPRGRRAVISIAFMSRLILIPVIILRLIYLHSALASSDKTFDYRDATYATLANVNASVLVACIPFLKPFMKGLDSGLLTSDLRVRAYGGPKSSLFQYSGSGKASGNSSRNYSHPLKNISAKRALDSDLGRLHNTNIQHDVSIAHDPPSHDFESRTSAGSDKMIIKRTTEWNVDYGGGVSPGEVSRAV